MREVVYRNLTPPGSRKKDVFIQETFEKNGVTAKTERRCFYFVKEVSHFDTIDDLREWEDAQTRSGAADKKEFYIFKKHRQ